MIYGGLGLGFSASGLGGCDSGRRLLGFFFAFGWGFMARGFWFRKSSGVRVPGSAA